MTTIAEFRKRMGYSKSEKIFNWYGPKCDYHSMVKAMGYEILVEADIGGYQGDYYFLLRDSDKGIYGFLSVGYGSCSGCDAMLSCKTDREVVDLYDSIQNDIIWKSDNAAEMWDWMKNRDWEGTILGYESESESFQEFLRNCKAQLRF